MAEYIQKIMTTTGEKQIDYTALANLPDLTSTAGGYYSPQVDIDGNLSWTPSKEGMPAVSETNIKGQKGDPGPQGIKGATGATPNIQIGTVTTLSAGSDATASITGTTANPKLNLGIPKGADGSSSDWTIDTTLSVAGSPADAKAVGDALATKINKSGDTLTGPLNVKQILTITPSSAQEGNYYGQYHGINFGEPGASVNIEGYYSSSEGGMLRFQDTTRNAGRIILRGVKTPEINTDAVNKEYIDSFINRLPSSGFSTCETATNVQTKIVAPILNFNIVDGSTLYVRFSNGNNASGPRLSINNIAYPIYNAETNSTVAPNLLEAGTRHFVYYGGVWVLMNPATATIPSPSPTA